MASPGLPSADEPVIVGEHRVYFVDEAINVIVYGGDLVHDDVVRVIDVLVPRGRTLQASIIDVSRLGSVSLESRRMINTAVAREVLESGPGDMVVYVVNADVTRRAIMTLVGTAGRLIMKRRIRTQFVKTFAEAEQLARAHCQANAARAAE
ncbi:MAG: hypothetical protein H6713_35010 [Myxococcales bacterium]|nr:hypothetical protein [Myxococcales bacterium]MCB9755178.1 hypothetical protein [Myxococcales bacterium]